MKAIDVTGLVKDFGTMVKVFPVESGLIVVAGVVGVVAAQAVTRFDERKKIRKRLESWVADYENQRNQNAEMESED